MISDLGVSLSFKEHAFPDGKGNGRKLGLRAILFSKGEGGNLV